MPRDAGPPVQIDLQHHRRQPLPTEAELLERWGGATEPLVSIVCTTYNQRGYIEDALRGFLLQETPFPFEIIVHDDASSDGTTEIVRELLAPYPTFSRLVTQRTNLFSKGGRPFAIALEQARGEFVAVCEGDDFWRGTDKLRKQVESLRANSQCVVSCHDACVMDAEGRVVEPSKLPDQYRSDKSAAQLLRGEAWLLTLTWLVRRSAMVFPPEINRVLNRDTFMVSVLGLRGGSRFETDIEPAVYRTHAGGVWSTRPESERAAEILNLHFWLARFHRRDGDPEAAAHFEDRFTSAVMKDVDTATLASELAARLHLPGWMRRWLRARRR